MHGKFLHREEERAFHTEGTEEAKAWRGETSWPACGSLRQSGVGSIRAYERV